MYFSHAFLNLKMSNNSFVSESLETAVKETVELQSDELKALANKIWSNPELSCQEYEAVEDLCGFLTRNGYTVTKNYKDISTAFLGEYQTPGFDAAKDPCVAVLCEYDALPEIGHACGHNLVIQIIRFPMTPKRKNYLNLHYRLPKPELLLSLPCAKL